MKRSIRLAFAVAALSLGCGGPVVMLPGGKLSGTVQPPPADWAFSDDVDNIQLETRPDDPYSVNLWGVGVGATFYIVSGRGLESGSDALAPSIVPAKMAVA